MSTHITMMSRILSFSAAFALSSLPVALYAATLGNPLEYDTLAEFLRAILGLVVQIGFPVIVLFIVFIGFKFVAASGNAEELKKVRGLFFWALVGALVVLGAQALSLAIENTVEELQRGI